MNSRGADRAVTRKRETYSKSIVAARFAAGSDELQNGNK
jgi:hypothetical protein